ncbi:hypothetical protein AB434_1643 [Heyndrickxia coagulans]|nr:hypothetical protein AB434_1643 [Heyndrickxia coagulans]ATW84300.1 hypothetical protein CIW84_15660 [Heyndrickxia coagulans]AWP35918.1 hypothetical protein CYJ15_02360 [Heyndrickxia coagulans]KGB30395.1 hypothetical protein IE89_05305 [Heyndrickxia coagulans]KXT19354.1 hypothetical protein UZ35_15600 [Heyndrickxia coagulans]
MIPSPGKDVTAAFSAREGVRAVVFRCFTVKNVRMTAARIKNWLLRFSQKGSDIFCSTGNEMKSGSMLVVFLHDGS